MGLDALAFDRAVDGRAADAEEFADLEGGALAAVHRRDQVRFLATVQFGMLARQRDLPLSLGTFIPPRVRSQIRSESNSATMNRSLPRAPWGHDIRDEDLLGPRGPAIGSGDTMVPSTSIRLRFRNASGDTPAVRLSIARSVRSARPMDPVGRFLVPSPGTEARVGRVAWLV